MRGESRRQSRADTDPTRKTATEIVNVGYVNFVADFYDL